MKTTFGNVFVKTDIEINTGVLSKDHYVGTQYYVFIKFHVRHTIFPRTT